jgi:hypothetical protein
MFKHLIKALLALAAICGVSASHASDINFLSIEGVTGPGDVGAYPADAGFSWSAHRYPDATVSHIWQLAPGSDGGIVLGQAQSGRGAITEVRPMYNINSWLYSVGGGVTFNANSALDFSTMHLKWGDADLQFGVSPGFDSLIPLVSDITALTGTENGYVVYGDGKYDLIYHDAGLCDGCEITLHLHGMAMAVPEPGNSLLWMLGLASVSIRLFSIKKMK